MEVANSLMNTQKSVVVAEEIGSGAPKETAAEFRAKHQRMSDVLELSPEAEKIMTEGKSEERLIKDIFRIKAASAEDMPRLMKEVEQYPADWKLGYSLISHNIVPIIDWEHRTLKGEPLPDGMYNEPTTEMLSGEQIYRTSGGGIDGTIYYETNEDETDRGLRRDYEMIKNSVEHIENIEIKIQNMRNDSAEAGQNNSHEISSFGMADGIIKSYLINTLEGLRNPQGYYIDPQYARDHILELSGGKIDINELYEKYLGDEA